MYNVQPMKPLKVAEARARFGEMLDEAESGADVIIERRGVRFKVTAESGSPARTSSPALFDYVDPDVVSGQWTWKTSSRGVTFSPRRKRR